MGMAHQWPAVRLGGAQPANNQLAFVPFDLASVPSANSVQLIVTQPSGAVKTYSCSKSPCPVTMDKRQGEPLVKIKYLSASGAVLAQSEPELLRSW
jgi:hypothetical protein